MARTSVSFACSACGATAVRWVGRCAACGEFGTVAEVRRAPPTLPGMRRGASGGAPPPARRIAEISAQAAPRSGTGLGEFDRVLGGGLVAGQVLLLAGEPGVGKSTLLLTVAHRRAVRGVDRPVLYVSGEESAEQIVVRARRIGADADRLLVADTSHLADIVALVEAHAPDLLIVDSVQTIVSAEVEGRAGGVSQVHEVAQALTRLAKSRGMALLLIGQSTREHSVAGPRALEHLVDTVLTFEGDRHTSLRLLRAVKNRFGPADEVVCFEQHEDGLREVHDPSQLFLAQRDDPVPGTCVSVTVEGRRALLAEVQALVAHGSAPVPRRAVTGLDVARVAMLVAVTQRVTRVPLAERDVFVATVGGARISDPASDLAVCLAIASAAVDRPVPPDVLAIGEVALSGDVRTVPLLGQRVSEAARLGFRRIVVPAGTRERIGTAPRDLVLHEAPALRDALRLLR